MLSEDLEHKENFINFSKELEILTKKYGVYVECKKENLNVGKCQHFLWYYSVIVSCRLKNLIFGMIIAYFMPANF